jgi:hypothetical protein
MMAEPAGRSGESPRREQAIVMKYSAPLDETTGAGTRHGDTNGWE